MVPIYLVPEAGFEPAPVPYARIPLKIPNGLEPLAEELPRMSTVPSLRHERQ